GRGGVYSRREAPRREITASATSPCRSLGVASRPECEMCNAGRECPPSVGAECPPPPQYTRLASAAASADNQSTPSSRATSRRQSTFQSFHAAEGFARKSPSLHP